MNPYSIIIKPLVSEKSVTLREQESKYSFLVLKDASKDEIKKAVESLFSVAVESINTTIVRGKVKRRGIHLSKLNNKKKAYVTLRAGQKIKIFDDQ